MWRRACWRGSTWVGESDTAAERADTTQAIDGFLESPLRQALVALVTLKIAGLLLIFDIAGLQAFDFPKSLFSRAIEWLLIGVIAALMVRYGIGVIPRTRLHLIAAAFVLANAISALFAENTYIALYGDRDRYMGLTFVVDMAVLYLAVAVGFRRNADWAPFAIGVGAASLLVMAYAWIQYLGFDPIVWSDDPATRPFSTLGHPDHIGHVLSVVFGAALGMAIFGGGRAGFALRIAAAAICIAVLATAAVVATRGTLLGVGAALVVLPLVLLRASGQLRAALASAILAAGTAVIVLVAMLTLTPLGERVQRVEEGVAVESRFVLFEAAARAFVERPIFGYGPDNFGVALPSHRQRGDARALGDEYYSSAHNWLLQAAATTGVAGVLAVCALALGSLAALWRGIVGPLPLTCATLFVASIAYWTHGLVAVGSNSIDWVPWLALGAAAGRGSQLALGTQRRRRWTLVLSALCVVASLGAATTVASAFAANRDAWVARTFVQTTPESLNSAVATGAAESAVARDPGRAEYWTWLGIAHGSAGRWDDASYAFEEAAARAPHEWLNWANVARARTRGASGSTDPLMSEALIAARRAADVDPNAPLANVALSETAFAAGSYELALESAVSAISLDPTRNFDVFATRPAARVTDLARARGLLEEATRLRGTAPLHLALAQVALRLGDTAAARSHAMRVLQLSPGNAEALAILRMTGG